MAEKDFLLPDLGEGLTEGEIVSWLVSVGDPVEVDQPVAEVETAKAVVEVPSPFAGTVTKLHAEPGDEVEVGKPLVSIDLDAGVPAAEPDPTGGLAPVTPAEPAQAESEPGGIPGHAAKDAEVGEAVPQPTPEAGDDASGSVLVGYGTGGGARTRRRRGAKPGGATGPAAGAPPGRPLAKPPVRKLAKDLGVDLAQIEPSGPGGVVTREDVQAFVEQDGQAAEAPAARAPEREEEVAPAPRKAPAAPPSEDLVERRPLKGVRKAIAEKMTVSRREIPEATTWVDVDATELWELRRKLNEAQDGVRVSALAVVMRACVAGLREFPEVNATLDAERNEIILQRFVNLGFAAQTDVGLMVPVIHGADRMSTLQIAAELNRLATAARERKVSPEELSGGTFTVSNYGSFGVDGGSAVINHPEAAILGVGRISERPWVHERQVQVRKVMQLSIAFDHRVCDGGEAAGFLRYVGDMIEDPTALLAAL